MSPVLKPRGPGQEGFRPWGVRTRTRLSRRGRSHRSVHSTAQRGHAAQRLQVGASLGSPGKPPLTEPTVWGGADGRGQLAAAGGPRTGRAEGRGGPPSRAAQVAGVRDELSGSRVRREEGSLGRRAGPGAGRGCGGPLPFRRSEGAGWTPRLSSAPGPGLTADARAGTHPPRTKRSPGLSPGGGQESGRESHAPGSSARRASRPRCPAARNRVAHSSAARQKRGRPGREGRRRGQPYLSSPPAPDSPGSARPAAPGARRGPLRSVASRRAPHSVGTQRRPCRGRGTRRRGADGASAGPRACAPSRGGGCALRRPPGCLALWGGGGGAGAGRPSRRRRDREEGRTARLAEEEPAGGASAGGTGGGGQRRPREPGARGGGVRSRARPREFIAEPGVPRAVPRDASPRTCLLSR